MSERGHLPKDSDSVSVQVLSPGTSTNITIGVSSNSLALQSSWVIRVASLVDCWIAFGNGSVTATTADMLFPAGVETYKVPKGASHIAVIRNIDAGILNVTRMD
tara:strand:- start:6214 stop:6525 length:312 start_codon:yes stop_codon:yes gene_type:complete